MEPIVKPENLSYEDFAKLDIRTGTIVKSEAVPKSKKLLKLEVYFGAEIGNRIILAGIAESFFESAYAIGRQVVAIVNLAPRSMMEFVSHGMLLAGKQTDGYIELVQCMGVADGGTIG